ncbi:hypothetical protein TruAng_006601 [Truncatella angustata]|nr:hypothetical protein TruAng_006601 [Truncatella angustata]
MSSNDNNNNSNNNNNHNFLATLRDTFTPNDKRKPPQGSKELEPKPRPRRESDLSTTSSSSATTTGTEMHRDATGVGSHFLDGLTPGRQRRRRSSILEALGGLGGGAPRERRDSAGSSLGGEKRDGKGNTEKNTDKYDMYVRL